MSAADVVGWYDFEWARGSFEVCFRPAGHFFCPKFQAPARWTFTDGVVDIDWAKFGKYSLKFDAQAKMMDGGLVVDSGKEPAETDWRKAKHLRQLSPVEALIIGKGAGSLWDFEWSGGKFEVEFKADGYNHFKCSQFPAHAHWSLAGDVLRINWAQYGKYTLTVDADAKTMSGASDGAEDPPKDDEWRKAKFSKDCEDLHTIEACDHHH